MHECLLLHVASVVFCFFSFFLFCDCLCLVRICLSCAAVAIAEADRVMFAHEKRSSRPNCRLCLFGLNYI